VAGVVASLAAALAGMGGRFSVRSEADQAAICALVRRADKLRLQCCDLADADTRAYAAFAQARQISTDDGGMQRRMAMQAARNAAVMPPLELAKTAREIADVGLELVSMGNPDLRSDACAAVLFASAAAAASAILVRANITAGAVNAQAAQANAHAEAAARAARQATGMLGSFGATLMA
jgi:formiminotetrahydrofolate cyclodeaminase